jgi:ABC-type lipoprotein export system ATPase subunit
MLELTSISRTFRGPSGAVSALSDVSLTINAGEMVAVQGPSGCGKSTLLLIAGGLLRPQAGSVLLNGQDVYGLPPERRAGLRATSIGFVFQQFHLIPYLSVIDNILTAASPESRGRAAKLVERFGLQSRAHHVPGQLSAGEQQRVALARALVNAPKLILADEPTGNLDPQNAEAVLSHLAAIASEGAAVLLVTHDASAASRGRRIVRMQAGRIAG